MLRWPLFLASIFAAMFFFQFHTARVRVVPPTTQYRAGPPTTSGDVSFPPQQFVGYLVRIPNGQDGRGNTFGTAFSIDSATGTWMTNRHVVEGCKLVLLDAGKGVSAVVDQVTMHPTADIALLKSDAAAIELPLASKDSAVPERAFTVGFAQLSWSVRSLALKGWTRSYMEDGLHGYFTSLVWDKTFSFGADRDQGLSGAPVLDANGQVRGMVASTQEDGHRLGAVAQPWIASFLESQGIKPHYAPLPGKTLSTEELAALSWRIRQEGSVRPVYCLRDTRQVDAIFSRDARSQAGS
jgi:S1-C subfamily serine protease